MKLKFCNPNFPASLIGPAAVHPAFYMLVSRELL